MRMGFDVQVHGLQNIENATQEQAKKVLWLSMHKMEELAKKYAPVDTGRLRSSINLSPRRKGAKTYTLADGVVYGVFLEYGTTPHFPPITPLKKWSRRVLGDESLAFAVAHSISKKGTPAHPFFRPALLEVKTVHLPRYWKQIMSQP